MYRLQSVSNDKSEGKEKLDDENWKKTKNVWNAYSYEKYRFRVKAQTFIRTNVLLVQA